MEHEELRRLIEAMSIANDTQLTQKEGRWGISGEPTEGALQALAGKLGFDPTAARRTSTLPFSSENKLMATVADMDGSARILVKGAPDRLLDRSATQLRGTEEEPLDRAYWEEQIELLSAQGLRVLAAAERPAHQGDAGLLSLDALEELTFLGVVGIVDPPREAAIAAIETCHDSRHQREDDHRRPCGHCACHR
ncbi:hypothetical protein [Nesterenkonia pannonica]|uniref:hypothetical protein n=1 Tax=Nesterenkonia pannonica TaxID=1548602 RepID=UPI002164A8D9|nr:hypothetical protein [Nesterenkonia pannonica]